jgi:hypothetical protein
LDPGSAFLARAVEPAGRRARRRVSAEAVLADMNALIDLLSIIRTVLPPDADTLLFGVILLLGAAREKSGNYYQR